MLSLKRHCILDLVSRFMCNLAEAILGRVAFESKKRTSHTARIWRHFVAARFLFGDILAFRGSGQGSEVKL
jgi:hypothetical protein